MLGYLLAEIICSQKQTVFRERRVQMICLSSYRYFSQHVGFEDGEDHSNFPPFNRGIFSHVMRLEQSRASENI